MIKKYILFWICIFHTYKAHGKTSATWYLQDGSDSQQGTGQQESSQVVYYDRIL